MRKLLLLLLLSLIGLVSAQGNSLAPYDHNYDQIGEYRLDYLIYYPNNASQLYEHIAGEDNRDIDLENYKSYSLSEVGDNYYIDTYIAPAGRMYHILMYGDGWVLDAVAYKGITDFNTNYKVECKEKNKDKIKIKKRCNEDKGRNITG
jgi:hypothetical protein